MKRFLTAAMFSLLGAFFLQSGVAMAAMHKHGVVYELDSADLHTEKHTLGNIRHHIDSPSGPSTRIELVIHGGGYKLLTRAKNDPQLQAAIDNLKMSGVAIKVCNNTLHGHHLDYKKDLYDVKKSDIVPSGVAELANKQFAGWAYIHP